MKSLVVFYSKTGNTRKIGKRIAKILGADFDEIIDPEGKGEKSAGKSADIEVGFSKDPSVYDLVVIGSPVWGFSVPPPTKSYIRKNRKSIDKVAFFCTYGLFTGFFFYGMKRLCGDPVAKLKVHQKRLEGSDGQIAGFCDRLKH
jgi:flavodoxin